MFKKYIFMLVLAFLTSFVVMGQSSLVDADWLKKLDLNLKRFAEAQAIEKIHLQTDKGLYAPADTIWFKVHLVDAALKPLKTSAVGYVALLSEKEETIILQKIFVKNGSAAGMLSLPDTLLAGSFTLLAYTNWMRNTDAAFFFRKPIRIVNPSIINKSQLPAPKPTLADLAFFPEGGDIVAGLSNKIGFKAVAENGLGIEVEGKILDESGKVVATLKSLHAGIGSFTLLAEKGREYIAQVVSADNRIQTFLLPKAKSTGAGLHVEAINDTVTNVSIVATPEFEGAEFYISVQSQGRILFSKKVVVTKSPSVIRINKKELPDGISQITLFNSKGLPAAERLFFVNNQRQLKIILSPGKRIYRRRELASVYISVKDYLGRPVETALSLGITDQNQNSLSPQNPTILTNLLLTSDLMGLVEAPGYYFSEDGPKVKEALDNLLLTQGWRRFAWEKVIAGELPTPIFQKELVPIINGYVDNNGNLLANAVIYFLEMNTGRSAIVTSDSTGKFNLTATKNIGQEQYLFQVYHRGNFIKQAAIRLQDKASPITFKSGFETSVDPAVLQKNILRTQIDKTYGIRSMGGSFADSAGAFINKIKPDRAYPLGKYDNLKDVEEVFKELIPSVRIRSDKNGVEARVFNINQKKYFQSSPLFFIDGKPTWNNDLALRMNADQVKEIGILLNPESLQQFGGIGNHGIILIKTKSGNFTSPELQNQNFLTVNTSASVIEFYVPKYTNTQDSEPDFRPVLYWNPSIKTNSSGEATITFPASDAISTFGIYTEGITDSGMIGNSTATFKTLPGQ